jgi:two-component system chemotaxis response regulator CheB
MHLVLCRNVLIYFDKVLQKRVLNLICESLVYGGFLCLGSMESLLFSDVEMKFDIAEEKEKIYRKRYNSDEEKNENSPLLSEHKAIVIGVSAGGLKALNEIFSSLKKDFQIPIIVTQHLSPKENSSLAEILNFKSKIKVIEADENMKIMLNHIYIGPADNHLLINSNGCFSLSKETKVNYSRPSIDVMFKSASLAYGKKLIGILLTGANEDGAEGIKEINNNGGLTIAQDPATAEYNYMPASAIETGMVDRVLNLKEIIEFLNKI